MSWHQANGQLARLVELARSARPDQMAATMIIAVLALSILFKKPDKNIRGAPFHGYRSWFEPTFLLQARFVLGAHEIISSGYKKVLTPIAICDILFAKRRVEVQR